MFVDPDLTRMKTIFLYLSPFVVAIAQGVLGEIYVGTSTKNFIGLIITQLLIVLVIELFPSFLP